MIRMTLLSLTLLASSLSPALATPPRLGAESPAVGAEARAWIDLQKSGTAASATPRPLPGEVADRVYQRWLNSHDQAIPAQFSRESFSSGGN